MDKEYKDGKITISRASSNVRDDYINIALVVEGQHIQVEMELEQYAYAITGLSRKSMKIRGLVNIGE